MKEWVKFSIVTAIVGIPAFVLGKIIWPPAMAPTGALLAGFMLISLIEALLFGFGVAFIAFGYPMLRRTHGRKKILPLFIATAWLLVSWWPHDNMHAHNGMDLIGLIKIDYIFHVTLIIAALVIAKYVYSLVRDGAGSKDTDLRKGGYEVWK